MEIKLLSRNTITSSPIPPNLETFQLWFLEKLSPLVYTPLFLFFPNKNNNDPQDYKPIAAIDTLKSSLSEALKKFFFLEEVVDNSISCNYEEIIFVTAKVSCSMFEIFKEPNTEDVLMKLIMYSTLWTDPYEKYAQVAIQATIFDCGGVAIALCLLHELMDATTISCFLRSWVDINAVSFNSLPTIACSDFGPISPLFERRQGTIIFSSNYEQKGCFHRLVFKDNAIHVLKAKAESSDHVQNPTCVEVFLSFLWKCVLEVKVQSCSVITLHNRLQPLSSKFLVGNFWWVELAHCLANEIMNKELFELVGFLRNSFQEIYGEWIKRLVGNEGIGVVSKLLSADIIPKLYLCTNWESVDLNEVEFGWEISIWVGESNMIFKNIGILLRVVSGDETEIWIVMDEEEIELLVQNQEFYNFAFLSTSLGRRITNTDSSRVRTRDAGVELVYN